MKNKKPEIENEMDYQTMMDQIDKLMKKGENGLAENEADELRIKALIAQEYEKKQYVIKSPKTIEGMIELKMYENKMKQKDLAKMLGIGEPKLSEILAGKRKPDVAFLKSAYQKLHIDPGFLLENA